MTKKHVIFPLAIFVSIVSVSTVFASGLNVTCVNKCGSDCCTETEECSFNSLSGRTCRQKGKMVYCADGLSYCIEPNTCCGVMSCCPSNTKCCGLNTCCEKGAVCCGMSTCCPAGSSCCGFSTCCSRGSRCVNGYCRAPWSSSMRWYYLIAVLIPFMFVLLYLAKRRQMRLAQQRGQIIRFGTTTTRRQQHTAIAPLSPPVTGYDPAPTMFEPPPYSEIAQLPPEFIPNEKPPAYSELYTDSTTADSTGTNTVGDTGNQAEIQDSNNNTNNSVENQVGNQTEQQSQLHSTTQSNSGVQNS